MKSSALRETPSIPYVVESERYVPAPGVGPRVFQVDDGAFDELIVESYREVRTVRGAGIRIDIENVPDCRYLHDMLRRRFERDDVPYVAQQSAGGSWRIVCVEMRSMIEVRCDPTLAHVTRLAS